MLWDPSLGYGANAFKRVDPPIDPSTGKSANIWCSGTSFLSDGRVLVTGGNFSYIDNPGDQYAGLKQVYTFNPFSETWTRQPDMAHGRWYPSQLLMPDGRTVIIQGLDETKTGAKNPDVEIFTPAATGRLSGRSPSRARCTGQFIGDYYPHMFWMPEREGHRRRAVHERLLDVLEPGHRRRSPRSTTWRTCSGPASGATP